MNGKILGLVFVFGLAISSVASWSNQDVAAQNDAARNGATADQDARKSSTLFAAKDGLIAIDLEGSAAADQVAVIDPKARTLAVYQINKQSGEISLKSVRKMHWDLQLDDYNGNKPIVRDIRSTVEKNLGR